MKRTYINSSWLIMPVLLACLQSASAQTQALSVDLCSPKSGDHFETTKPLLFWKSTPGSESYEIYVDDAKAGVAPTSAGPILNYALTSPLMPGLNHWFVKAIAASGDAISSNVSTFTIDSPGNWPSWAIGPFVRYGNNPLFRPQGTGWESVNAFNPGVLFNEGKYRMLYRAQARAWTSREGYAESTDGVTFARNPEPVIDATESFEKNYGCEDARLFKYQGTYYAFYTGNNPGGGIALCEATSQNGTDWKKLGVVVARTKNAAMICDPHGTPVKINGKFTMIVGNGGFWITYSDDLVTWTPKEKTNIKLPPGWVGPYEPCVAVTDFSASHPDNIVLFIAGTLNGKGKWFYAISEMLLSKADPTQEVDHLSDCIMKPEEPYESGQNKNCLWTNCIIEHGGQWMMYYGAGDRNVALATAPIQ